MSDTVEITSFKANKNDGSLPFSYTCAASEFKVWWMCNKDSNGRITSIFFNADDPKNNREVKYLENMKEANRFRNTLIENGWEPKDIPIQFDFTTTDADGNTRKLNRAERRHLEKQQNKFLKENSRK